MFVCPHVKDPAVVDLLLPTIPKKPPLEMVRLKIPLSRFRVSAIRSAWPSRQGDTCRGSCSAAEVSATPDAGLPNHEP